MSALRNISAFSGQGGGARTYLILAHRDLGEGVLLSNSEYYFLRVETGNWGRADF